MNIFSEKYYINAENELTVTRGARVWGRGVRLGVWDWHVNTAIYKI